MVPAQKNPLTAFMRKPKLYLKLPSQGNFWAEGSLDMPPNGEFPVYGMTAKDEMLIRTPDALFNGTSTVEVIRSCIPNILDPWMMPSIDLDAILIAIRIASYGEKMPMKVFIPGLNEEEEFEIDLRPILDEIINDTNWDTEVKVNNDITIYIEPVNYKAMTDYQIINFDSNRALQVMLQDEGMTESQKLELAAVTMSKLAEGTLMQLNNGVKRVDTSEGNTTDEAHIKEFVANIDKEIFGVLAEAFRERNKHNGTRMIKIIVPPNFVEKGAPESLEVPFQFDYASFFV